MTNATPTNASLPDAVIERTREWAFGFNFGEWFATADIAEFMREEFGYAGTTPQQYAARFVARGVFNQDFETRLHGKQWRWIAHPSEA